MVDVFISYSRTDLAEVTRLAQMVEAEGYEVWWDADLPPHLSYGDVITAKIGSAKAAIVVWSQTSAASEWVRAEADMARNQKKLIQTALDNVMPPLPFNQIQFAEIGDWHGEPDHPGWRKVKTSLAELCGPGRENEARPAQGAAASAPATPPPAVPPPAAVAALRWPLYAGIGLGAVALAVAGWAITSEERLQASEERLEEEIVAERHEAELAPAPSPEPAAAREQARAAEPEIESTEGMIVADSDRRLLTEAEIARFEPATLEIARNEIYARKGRRFRRADLRAYFSQFGWYRPVADEVALNAIERQNVALLRAAEARYEQ